MMHPFMHAVAELASAGVSVLRYQFAYMDAGLRRPDAPALAHAVVRAAVTAATGLTTLPLFAGGKSFGGRMTSHAQAADALPGIRGLVFFGFPLHPAGKPGIERARHLGDVRLPMLFLQGSRETLAEIGLLARVVARLPGATSAIVEAADHSFHVPRRSGRTDTQVLDHLCATTTAWMRDVLTADMISSKGARDLHSHVLALVGRPLPPSGHGVRRGDGLSSARDPSGSIGHRTQGEGGRRGWRSTGMRIASPARG